jgi:hypothetical protein
MRKTGLFLAVVAATVVLSQPPKALGSVGGTLGSGTVGDGGPQCGSSGTLYENLTFTVIVFDLSLVNGQQSSNCTITVSWTDASGTPQTITLGPYFSTVVSTSLPANGIISWSSSSGNVLSLQWQLERPPSASLAADLLNARCGSSGTLYSNLTRGPFTLDLGISSGQFCSFTLSWTDTGGHVRTIALDIFNSEGVSTEVPGGGAISWTSGTAGFPVLALVQVERVVK